VLIVSGEIIAAFSVGVLLALSFPPFEQAWIAWFALVPLLLVLRGKKAGQAFFLSFNCGVSFFLSHFHWILPLSGYTLLHHALLAVYLGSYFALFGAAYACISRRFNPALIPLIVPFVWVALEFIRSNFFFLALPWGILAHSQYRFLTLLQVSSLSGTHGISFLLIMTNCIIAALISRRIARGKNGGLAMTPRRGVYSGRMERMVVLTVLGILFFSLLYGHFALKKPFPGTALKVAVVQGNIAQERKWDPKYAGDILETYRRLSLEASREEPALIVWPEAATPRAINRDPDLLREIHHIAGDSDACLLVGSTQVQKFSRGRSGGQPCYLNSAFLIPPQEKKISGPKHYDKIRLLPFGEYTPLKDWIQWSCLGITHFDNLEAGTKFTVFTTPDCRFGVTICWENIFPGLVRQFVNRGAQFIINITNEAWFGRSSAPYQFLSMSVFRAVENGLFVVRCSNTGVSCIIDPHGRIVARVNDRDGADTFVEGTVTGSIIPGRSGTLYTRYGDWMAWVSLSLSCTALGAALMPDLKNRIFPEGKAEVLGRKA